MRNLLRILRPARFLRQRAIYSGLFGGNRGWLMVGGAAWVMRWLRGLFAGGDPATVYLEELKPGQRLVVSHPESSVRSEKKSAKADKKSQKKQDKKSRRDRG